MFFLLRVMNFNKNKRYFDVAQGTRRKAQGKSLKRIRWHYFSLYALRLMPYAFLS